MTAHTIVIKALPTRTPSTLTITGQLENDMFDEMYGDPGGPRKRRRLTHLSPDEKQLRRKLKNRVAAQTARDRKKCLMDDLEQKIAELERQNRQLASENASLKAESGSLQTENVALKKQLGAPGTPIKTEPGCGSAVSNDLLLQGQTLPVSYWAKTYAASMLTLSLVLLASWLRQTTRVSRPSPQTRCNSVPCQEQPCNLQPRARWWGPQQQSWNPSMN